MAVCPNCQTDFGPQSGARYCGICGYDLQQAAPTPRWMVERVDLREAARRQRQLLWLILIVVAAHLVAFLFDRAPFQLVLAASAVTVLVQLAVLVQTVRLLAAFQVHIAWRVVVIVLMFCPCVNLFVLLGINQYTIRRLAKAGLKVGFMGVKDEDVVRFLDINACRGCGYNMIGNVSGVCPECGKPWTRPT